MKLYNVETQKWETDIHPSELYDRLLTGKYRPETMKDENGVEFVRMTLGPSAKENENRRVRVIVPQFARFIAENPDARLTTEYDDAMAEKGGLAALLGVESTAGKLALEGAATVALGPVGMAAPGLVDTVVGGSAAALGRFTGRLAGASVNFSDWVLAKANPELANAIHGQRGTEHTLGELEGAIGAAFIGQPFSVAGLGAKAPGVLKSAKALVGGAETVMSARKGAGLANLIPTTLLSSGSQTAGALATKILSSRASQSTITAALARVAGHTATMAGLGATEGALWGAAQALEEHALGDPRELGDLLAAGAGEGAAWGAATGGLFGGLAGLAGETTRLPAHRVANTLEKMDATGKLETEGIHAVNIFLKKEMGLSDSQIKTLNRHGAEDETGAAVPYLRKLFDTDLLEDGSIMEIRKPDGTFRVATPDEVATRLDKVRTTFGEAVGDFLALADREALRIAGGGKAGATGRLAKKVIDAGEAHRQGLTAQLARALENENILQRARASNAGDVVLSVDGKFTRVKIRHAAELVESVLNSAYTAARESPWVTAIDIRDAVLEVNEKMARQAGTQPIRDFLWRTVDAYLGRAKNTPAALIMNYGDDWMRERKSAQEGWRKLFGSWEASSLDSAAAQRALWKVLDTVADRKLAKVLNKKTLADWAYAKDVYGGVASLDTFVKDAIRQGGRSLMEKFLSKWGSGMSGRMFWVTQQVLQKSIPTRLAVGAAGAAIGGIAGGIPGAVFGGLAMAAGATALRAALPNSEQLAVMGYKLAINKNILSHVNMLRKAIDGMVEQTMSAAGKAKSLITPVIGINSISAESGLSADRKATPQEHAAALYRRVNTLLQPHALAAHVTEQAGIAAYTHPATLAAYNATMQRKLAAIKAALEGVPRPAAQGDMQPGLFNNFEDASPFELERAGLTIAAVVNPIATLREAFAGAATAEQLDAVRTVYPMLWEAVVANLALRISTMETPLTLQQKRILAAFGLRDWTNPPGFAQRSQMAYAAQPGANNMPQGRMPSAAAFNGMKGLDNAFATRDNQRTRTDQKLG